MEKQSIYHQEHDEISLSEIIATLWKYKWLIIIIPIIAAIIAYFGSKMITPTYESTTKLYLGNFGNEMYTTSEGAQEVILSKDLLDPIMRDLNLDYERTSDFRRIISVNSLPASMIEIKVSYRDPEVAQAIAQEVVEAFIAKAEPSYLEKLQVVEDLYEKTLLNYERTVESLNRNKEALTAIEMNSGLSNTEKDITRVRLLDYINNDEDRISDIEVQLQEQQLQLLEIHKAEVFEHASLPISPVSPKPLLNTAIAIVVGIMLAFGLAFIIEYFKNNPIKKS